VFATVVGYFGMPGNPQWGMSPLVKQSTVFWTNEMPPGERFQLRFATPLFHQRRHFLLSNSAMLLIQLNVAANNYRRRFTIRSNISRAKNEIASETWLIQPVPDAIEVSASRPSARR
jgi:hypothetical protein